MNSIPATSSALSPVGEAPSQARPTGIPAATLQPSVASRQVAAPPATPEARTAVPEAGNAAPDAGLGVPLMAQIPVWRSLPSQGSISRDLVLTGYPLPKGGKAMPPRMPTLPVVLPSPDAHGPGTRESPGVPAMTVASAPHADGQLNTVPARTVEPDASLPPVASAPGSVSAEEPASAGLPQEIVGRPLAAPGFLSVPVLAGARVQVPGAAVPDAAADSPPSSPQIAAGLPSWMLRARPAPASVHAPSGTLGLATSFAPAAEVSATGALLERAAAAETGATGGQATRLSIAPDAAILSTATLAQPAQPGSPAIAATQQHLPQMVGSEEWAEAVAQRLSQLVDSPHARASIRLNPPQLGPMQVEVHVDGDRAVVQLAVHHDATRDALEQAMPKLRAQLEDSGFTRIDVSISHNPHRERPGSSEPYLEASSLPEDDLPTVPAGSAPAAASRLLDAYA